MVPVSGDGGEPRERVQPALLAIDEAAAFLFAVVAFAAGTLAGEAVVPFGFLGLLVGWILILTRRATPVRVLAGVGLSAACLLMGIGPSF